MNVFILTAFIHENYQIVSFEDSRISKVNNIFEGISNLNLIITSTDSQQKFSSSLYLKIHDDKVSHFPV